MFLLESLELKMYAWNISPLDVMSYKPVFVFYSLHLMQWEMNASLYSHHQKF